MKHTTSLSNEEFALFQKLLLEKSGIYFSPDRNTILSSTLTERMYKISCRSYGEYYRLLTHSKGVPELRELLDLVTIGETYFFRNTPHFEALMKFILPDMAAKKSSAANKSLKLWSAGCSKGAETYSLAIAILETIPRPYDWSISILATDINRKNLAFAKEAIYSKRDIHDMPDVYLDKYFQKHGTQYQLNNDVKKWVKFLDHNLATDAFTLDGMKEIDIIFCRNVTIYFDLQTTVRILNNFYDCLAEGGYLFIGHAETLWHLTDKFEVVEYPQTFVYRKTSSNLHHAAQKPFLDLPELNDVLAETKKTAIASQPYSEKNTDFDSRLKALYPYKKIITSKVEKKYDETLIFLDEILTKDPSNIYASLTKSTVLANQGKYKEAINVLTTHLGVNSICVDARYLLGVLFYRVGDFKKAEDEFKKVLYLDSTVVLTYFNLGNIFLYQKKYKEAKEFFLKAVKLLEQRPADESVRFSEDFTVEILLLACRNNLEEIEKKYG